MKLILHFLCVLILVTLCNGNDVFTYAPSDAEMSKVYPPKPSEPLLPPSCGKKAAACDPKSKYSRLDGSCNNLKYPEWGLPNCTYSRLLPPAYADGISKPRVAHDNSPLPGSRSVRVTMFPVGSKLDPTRSLVAMQWGQIVTHDMSLLKNPPPGGRCCTGNSQIQDNLSKFCFPILISPTDPVLGSTMACMNFTRTMTDKDLGCVPNATTPAEQINVVTSWMDLSIVYDIETSKSSQLRAGVDGLMKTITRGNNTYPPQDPKGSVFSCRCNTVNETACYLGGDSRINQSPHLALLQIILLREHNRLATELKKINPNWNDDKLFQEARRINIAQYQYISYYEWLPSILGHDHLVHEEIIFPDSTDYVDDYDWTVSPSVTSEHAHAAFRHFHSQIAESLKMMDVNRNIKSSVDFGSFLLRPAVLEFADNFLGLSRGLLSQPAEDADEINVKPITNRMFACKPGQNGIDLRSFDIQRDRDHGIRYYNDYRNYCGVGSASCFEDFGDYISEDNIKKLKSLYKSHLDLDLSIGGALEEKINDSLVGPTFLCILMEQFKRTRKADRFWFEHPEAGFTKGQLAEIRKSSLSRLFCDNVKNLKKVQRDAFFSVTANSSTLLPCSSIPVVNLKKWRENNYSSPNTNKY